MPLVLLDGISASAIAGLFGLTRGDDYGTAEREADLPVLKAALPRTPRCLT